MKNVFLQKVSKKFFPWHKNVTTHTVYVGAHLGLELPAPRGPWSPSASTHVHQAPGPSALGCHGTAGRFADFHCSDYISQKT